MNREIDIHQYEIGKKIGRGNFAEVYLVKDKNNQKTYAAKRLLSSINLNPNKEDIDGMDEEELGAIKNFKREIGILTIMSHPAIISFIGYSPNFSDIDTCPTIIMEYASRKSLGDILEAEKRSMAPNDWDQTKRFIIIYGIAKGMEFLHSKKIIHRDLKPDNVMLNDSLYPKIADFGLSKVYDPLSQSQSMICGTQVYMAPELFNSEVYDNKVDVYAFSMLIYEIFTLKKPFCEIKTPLQLMKAISTNIRPKLPSDSSIPDEFINMIEICWDQDPKKRPTFTQICEQLESNNFEMGAAMEIDQNDLLEYISYINEKDVFLSGNQSKTDLISDNSKDQPQKSEDKSLNTTQNNLKNDDESKTDQKIENSSESATQNGDGDSNNNIESKIVQFDKQQTKSYTLIPAARNKPTNKAKRSAQSEIKEKSVLSNTNRKVSSSVLFASNDNDNNKNKADSANTDDDNIGNELRSYKSANDVIDLLEPIFPSSQLEFLGESRKKYVEDAERTDSDAMTYVGKCLIDGADGFPQDTKSGVKFLSKAIIFDNEEAMVTYGELLIKGEKVEKNVKKGVQILKRASNEHDSSKAKLLLAQVQLIPQKDDTDFIVSPENYVQAKRYSKEAADNGNVEAMVLYATLCMKEKNNEHGKVRRNLKEAQKYLKVAVNRGSKEAMVLYGQLTGLKGSKEESIELYRKSKELGSSSGEALYGYEKAQNQETSEEGLNLVVGSKNKNDSTGINAYGKIVFNGLCGVQADKAKAAKEFQVAAKAGNANAMYNYGHCLEKGEGVEKNFQEAFKYYKKAFQEGEIYAAKKIADMLIEGDEKSGFPKNLAEANRYLKYLADFGNAAGIDLYACNLLSGFGVEKNIKEAINYLKNGIEINDSNSYFLYGILLLKGDATHKSPSEASKLYINRAVELGNEKAREKGKSLTKANAENGLEEAIKYIREAYSKE
ncbi:hypothetical protein M9Y10_045766 [Tritrichomonas musculus]|uniref:Protein kinase domain-containing protein n=1 Tax=Tritrichomonas musculus TaxID=1915356 RepID=A0ABR2JWC1_9EUKA